MVIQTKNTRKLQIKLILAQREQIKLLNLELYLVRNNDLAWNRYDILIIDEKEELDLHPVIEAN